MSAPHAALLMVGETDPYWSYVVNLSHFDGADGTFGTLTNNAPGAAFVCNSGEGELDTSNCKFGSACLLRVTAVPGFAAAGTGQDTTNYPIGTGDFTVEFWFYIPTLATVNVMDMTQNFTYLGPFIYITNLGSVRYYVSAADRITGANGSISAATWTSICVCRIGTTTKLFVNGTQVGSNYTDSNNYNNRTITLAAFNANPSSGRWDEYRFTRGIGRYSGNYTPATKAFPNQ